ncbi:AraC family transcriptional regulator [Actinoplanes aureus]|uniref:AraC family transcriptional regulator n=1 Tax=Actinoplanes aureus TaxID=2792083 RepID=A0A931G7S7_9ACTN|nr:AraC family transcriptional regulator [Actinoplanes aureus]MBG0568559.1 AraC family transcriptional regulator [Actinoplanes aureus]
MDLLSAVLREARFESAGYRWLELGTPFRVGFDRPGLRGVHLVTRGRCEYALASGRTAPLGAGDLVIFPRGDAHLLRSPGSVKGPVASGMDLATRTPGIRLRAGGPVPDTVVMCGAFVVGEPDHPALRGLPRVLQVPGTAGRPQPWLTPLVTALDTEARDGGPGSDLVMARLSDAILIRALRHHGDTAPEGWLAGLADPYVAAALEALHADPARPWTLAALARVAGLSRAAFAARFTGRVGEPPMRYLLAIRMHRARSLLRDERVTVARVAGQVGYASEVAFAAAFKREVGTSPGAYRKAAR